MGDFGKFSLSERIEKLSETAGHDRVTLLNAIAKDLLFQDLDEASRYLLDSEDLLNRLRPGSITEEERIVSEGEIMRLRGVIAFYRAEYGEALRLLELASKFFESSTDRDGIGNCLNNLAMVHRYLDDEDRALEYYQQALDRARSVKDPTAESNTLGNIGILYYSIGELEKAGEFIEAALGKSIAAGNLGLEMVWSNNLGELLISTRDFSRARKLLERALLLSESRDELSLRIDIWLNFGRLECQLSNDLAACDHFRKALETAEVLRDRRMCVEIRITLGRTLFELGSAHASEDPLPILEKALEQAQGLGVKSLVASAHKGIADCFVRDEQFSEAVEHLYQHSEIIKSHHREETDRRLMQQRIRFELEQTQRDLQSTKEANAQLREEIRRREKAEAEMKQALVQASRASDVKSQFLATMSHEIRTPLNGIIGMSDVLAQSGLNQEQRDALQVVQESGRMLLTLINDVLDISKVEAGRIELESIPYSLRELMRSLERMFRPQAMELGVEFEVCGMKDVPRRIMGDPNRLRQILNNLLGNAFKFTEEGRVELRAYHEGPWIYFAVSDSGIGIPEDRLEAIFDVFIQVDSSTTRKFGGTGLGLAICRRFAELMGGSVSVRSSLGDGSVFTLRLPCQPVIDPRDRQNGMTNGMDPEEERLRVLVVEDAEFNWKVVSLLLRRMGVEPDWVRDGFSAVNAVREEEYDVVLMDVQMPGLDGLQATRQIRADETMPYQPVIVALTAHEAREEEKAYANAGMDGYLVKPIDRERLAEVLKLKRVGASG